MRPIRVAVIDYGLGNLFSIQKACEHVNLQAVITSSRQDIWASDAVILPGVGAFGSAMESLRRLDLLSPLREIATSEKPLIGICLGLQLLMTESYEFGHHRGLGVIEGEVVSFKGTNSRGENLKVPHVGWNGVTRVSHGQLQDPWANSPMEGLRDGEYMYFINSFYATPEDPGVVLSVSRYGNIEFCSSLRFGNIFATQFHPERSGPHGLHIYRHLCRLLQP